MHALRAYCHNGLLHSCTHSYIGEEQFRDLRLIIVFKYHQVIVSGMCGNDLIGYYPPSLQLERVSIGLYFYFSKKIYLVYIKNTLQDITMSSCVLCGLYMVRNYISIKIVLMVKVILLKYKRNCYLWGVKWK